MNLDLAIPQVEPWASARAVMEDLRRHGHQAVIVGGCIRDLLLGRPVHDIDLATEAVPERVEAIFPRTVAVGRQFGVILVLMRKADGTDETIEVATFRADSATSDGRRPVKVLY